MPKTKRQKQEQLKQSVVSVMEDIVGEIEKDEDSERRAGKTIRGQKVPWTKGDIEAVFPIVEFTPDETIPIIYNGVRYQLISGVSVAVPSIILDSFKRHKRASAEAGRTLPDFGFTPSIELGVGGLPTEV